MHSKAHPYEEKREFLRVDFAKPVKFHSIEDPKRELRLGLGSNISQSGILFKSKIVPKISTVLWMNVDFRTLQMCREIESRAVVYKDGLVGRVVRVEEDENELYNVGVCFLTKDEWNGLGSPQSSLS